MLFVGYAVAQTNVINTSFESPFVFGPLGGQQGWLAVESGTGFSVVTHKFDGTKAVQFDAAPAVSGNWAYTNIGTANNANGTWVANCWVKVSTDTLHNDLASFGLDAYGYNDAFGNGIERLVALTLDASGSAYLVEQNIPHQSPVINAAADVWHRITLVIDFAAGQATGYVDATPMGITVNLPVPAKPIIGDIDLFCDATGFNTGMFDLYSVTRYAVGAKRVSGRITLENTFLDQSTIPVTLSLLDGQGQVVESKNIFTSSSGDFETSFASVGTFTLRADGSTWLRKNLGQITLQATSGYVPVPAVLLLNGDVDGDEVVSIFDYIRVSNSFDLYFTDQGFDPAADLDGDLAVSIFDYIVMSDNFDKQGD